MNNKKTLLILILVFVLLMGGASVLYTRLASSVDSDQLSVQTPQQSELPVPDETAGSSVPATDPSEPPQIPAPDFTVYDAEGNAVRLSDYFGKPIVLNFWASWCGPCKMEMPDFQEKYLELGGDIHFLMVNMTDGQRETVETASEFIADQGYTFPVFFDTQSDAAMTYGAYSLPTTFFIDAQGYAIAQATGAINGETLLRGIDMIR